MFSRRPLSPLTPTIFVHTPPQGALISEERDLMETSNLDSFSSYVPVSLCTSSPLLPEEASLVMTGQSINPRSLGCPVSGFQPYRQCRHGLLLMVWASNCTTHWLVTQTSTTITLSSLVGRTDWGFCDWVGVSVPLLEALPGYIFTVSGCLSLTINNFSVWWLNIKK